MSDSQQPLKASLPSHLDWVSALTPASFPDTVSKPWTRGCQMFLAPHMPFRTEAQGLTESSLYSI